MPKDTDKPTRLMNEYSTIIDELKILKESLYVYLENSHIQNI